MPTTVLTSLGLSYLDNGGNGSWTPSADGGTFNAGTIATVTAECSGLWTDSGTIPAGSIVDACRILFDTQLSPSGSAVAGAIAPGGTVTNPGSFSTSVVSQIGQNFGTVGGTIEALLASAFGAFFSSVGTTPKQAHLTNLRVEVDWHAVIISTGAIDQLPIEIMYDAILLNGIVPDDDWDAIVPGSSQNNALGGGCACCEDTETLAATTAVGTGDPMSAQAIGLINPLGQWFDDDGEIMADGTLTFYAAGTTTLLDTYSDAALTTPNTNPVQLDGDGKAVVYLGPFVYKVDAKDSLGVSQSGYPRDNVVGSIWPARLAGAVTLSPASDANGFAHQLVGTLNKASTGTHPLFAGLYLAIPTINAGGAGLSEASTVYIVGAPAVGTLKYALHVAAGLAKFDGGLITAPTTFAGLPASPVDGQRGFITDSNTTTFNASAAGGGANHVPVFYSSAAAAWKVG